MSEPEALFMNMDGKIMRLLAEAKKGGLKPVALRLSPAADLAFKRSRTATAMRLDAEPQTWRGLRLLIEGSILELWEQQKKIRICVEAHAHGEHGRHYYFDADCSDLPELD